MRIAPLILLAATLAIGPAVAAREDAGSRDAPELARVLEGRTAGPAERCLPTNRNDSAAIRGDTLVWDSGRTIWVNRIADCPALRRDPILVFEVFGAQLCEREFFRTVDRGASIPGPSCQLGKFVPYRKPR